MTKKFDRTTDKLRASIAELERLAKLSAEAGFNFSLRHYRSEAAKVRERLNAHLATRKEA